MKVFDKLTNDQRSELKNGVIEVSGKAMNRTALGVVDAVFTMFPNITYSELKEILPDIINPSAPKNFKHIFKPHTNKLYGVIQSGEIRQKCEEAGVDIKSTHFIEEKETFKTSDGIEVLVSKVWESTDTETQEHDLQNLINHVGKYGIKVVSVEKKESFNKGWYNLQVLNPALLTAIQKEKKKRFTWWILFLLLLLITAIIFWFITNKKAIVEKEEPIVEQVTPQEISAPIQDTLITEIQPEIIPQNFQGITFKKNSDEILIQSEAYLMEVSDILKKYPQIKVHIIGHTSTEGANNNSISAKRAIAVAKYLETKGISIDRLTTEGRGSSQPIASNDTEEGRNQNRRIEFVVIQD
jgi:outer membrane protein OmpA-like peptidoglycan-associated protein